MSSNLRHRAGKWAAVSSLAVFFMILGRSGHTALKLEATASTSQYTEARQIEEISTESNSTFPVCSSRELARHRGGEQTPDGPKSCVALISTELSSNGSNPSGASLKGVNSAPARHVFKESGAAVAAEPRKLEVTLFPQWILDIPGLSNASRALLFQRSTQQRTHGAWTRLSGGRSNLNLNLNRYLSCPLNYGTKWCPKDQLKRVNSYQWEGGPNGPAHSDHVGRDMSCLKDLSLLFVGDSVSLQQFISLVCLFHASGTHNTLVRDMAAKKTPGVRVYVDPKLRFRVGHVLSQFLLRPIGVPLQPNWSPVVNADLRNLSLDYSRLPDNVVAALEELRPDIVVASSGLHFIPKLMRVHDTYWPRRYRKLVRSFLKRMADYVSARRAKEGIGRWRRRGESEYNPIVLLRTTQRSHFFDGEWNDGGHCEHKVEPCRLGDKNTRGQGEGQKMDVAEVLNVIAVEEVERAKGLRYFARGPHVFDAAVVARDRCDAHMNVARKGDGRVVNDCTHWCAPGPVDTWNAILLRQICQGIT